MEKLGSSVFGKPHHKLSTIQENTSGTQKAQYRKRQKDSFMAVGGGPEGWHEIGLKDVHVKKIKVNGKTKKEEVYDFDLPDDYQTVEPWSDRTPGAYPPQDYCQLCGWHPLVNHWPIVNDEKKMIMWVGSECVNNFMGAHYLTQKVKKFKLDMLRASYINWSKFSGQQIDAKGKINTHGGYYTTVWLPEPLYQFKKQLKRINPETASSTKLINVFKKAEQLGLQIPSTIEGIIGKEAKIEKHETKPEIKPVITQTTKTTTLSLDDFAKSPEKKVIKPNQIYPTLWNAGKLFVKVNGKWVPAIKGKSGIWRPAK